MKIMTVLGTRPEIIRLSRIIPLLDHLCEHVLVHTGQNYDPNLTDIFFQELCLRSPDYFLKCQAESTMSQIGMILAETEKVMSRENPDRLLILGDTNSALSAMAAKRMGITVFHMEAGNRCYDDRVPEEINRRVVDHCSDILLPYTERSRANLLREGISNNKIFVIGNPIKEVLDYHEEYINSSRILKLLNIEPQKYFLITLHRSENVDIPDRLNKFIDAFILLRQRYEIPVICSLHPRTRSRLNIKNNTLKENKIIAIPPPGLFDFVCLERQAACVLSDSGTVQEECCIFHVPNVTLRDVTERPETQECGSSILSGCEPDFIVNAVRIILNQECNWKPPEEYIAENVSQTVLRILLGI